MVCQTGDSKTLIEESTFIRTATGAMRTVIVRPAEQGSYPGIVLYSEIFQITGPIRRTAAALAGNGYVVAVPEIYHELEEAGTVLGYDQAGADRGNANKIGKEISSYDGDARARFSDIWRRVPIAWAASALWESASGVTWRFARR